MSPTLRGGVADQLERGLTARLIEHLPERGALVLQAALQGARTDPQATRDDLAPAARAIHPPGAQRADDRVAEGGGGARAHLGLGETLELRRQGFVRRDQPFSEGRAGEDRAILAHIEMYRTGEDALVLGRITGGAVAEMNLVRSGGLQGQPAHEPARRGETVLGEMAPLLRRRPGIERDVRALLARVHRHGGGAEHEGLEAALHR